MVRLAIRQGAGAEGLQLARALAMSTYRTPSEFAERFTAPPRFENGLARFAVEDYLMARGAHYAGQYSAASFLCLSESIDLHAIDATEITVPVRALGVREDQLVPLIDMQALCRELPQAELQEISSHYGHDAFLKELEILRTWLQPLTGESA
jgi:homoserine O-acetyltransferase